MNQFEIELFYACINRTVPADDHVTDRAGIEKRFAFESAPGLEAGLIRIKCRLVVLNY
jgi:hypothetical protein